MTGRELVFKAMRFEGSERLPLDFLDEDTSYDAQIFSDNPDSKSLTKVDIVSKELNSSSKLDHTLEAQRGVAVILRRK